MKKLFLFLRDGKLFYGSSLDDATALEVVNRELIADVVLMQEGHVYEVAKGWTVEIDNVTEEGVLVSRGSKYKKEGETELKDVRKIARLIQVKPRDETIFIDGDFNDSYEARVRRSTGKGKSKEKGGIAAVGVPEYGPLAEEYIGTWMIEETDIPHPHHSAPTIAVFKEAGIPESGEI